MNEDKNIKAKLQFAIRKKGEHLGTNIFKVVKRHSEGVYLVLQDGLVAELVSPNEIKISGAKIIVTFEQSDGPAKQKYIPATAADIHTAETALQHLAYEKGLSSDDASGMSHRTPQAQPQMNDMTI